MQLPSESAVTLRDDWGVNDLIAYLCRSQRSRIVVLLSARQRQTKPPVDADALKRRLGAKADGVVVPSALTFRLTHEFVRKRSACVGAARLLPHPKFLLLGPSTYLWKPAGFWRQGRDQVDSCRTISWRIVI